MVWFNQFWNGDHSAWQNKGAAGADLIQTQYCFDVSLECNEWSRIS